MVKCANGWNLRIRQEECYNKLIESYKKGYKDFFIAAVCRFGKTLTTTVTLRDLGNEINPESQVILILSTMNIKSEWFDGAEKAGFNTSLIGKNKDEMIDINKIDFNFIPEKGKHIVYVSTQKLGNNSSVSNALIKWFNNHEGLKTLVYDECHLGSGTLRTAGGDYIETEINEEGNLSETVKHKLGIIERLDYDNRVYLSGTPYRKYLNKEFKLDRASGEDICFKYTLTDEKIDFKNGLIKDYIPVQLQMHILDYSKQMDQLVNEEEQNKYHSISSAYFKKIFSDPQYEDRAQEFINKIIEFSTEHDNITNWLFYVPLKKVGDDLVRTFKDKYKDIITFLNISTNDKETLEEDKDVEKYEENVKGLNVLFAKNDGKIKIGITVQKCGTGATMPDLEAVAFLKDTTNAIQFIQKSQRPRTPKEGKTVGYVLCFNTFDGIQAFKDYAVAESKSNVDNPKEKDILDEFFENETVELYLDLKKVDDYAALIDLNNMYIPGRYPLFTDLDFNEWKDSFVFLTSFVPLKNDILKRNPKLRNNPDVMNANNLEDLANALEKADRTKEAQEVREVKELSEKDARVLLEVRFVDVIRCEFFNLGKTRQEVLDVNNYGEMTKENIQEFFSDMESWKKLLETYPRYVNMIYNYLESGFDN